jgi:hypothetical protein
MRPVCLASPSSEWCLSLEAAEPSPPLDNASTAPSWWSASGVWGRILRSGPRWQTSWSLGSLRSRLGRLLPSQGLWSARSSVGI